MAAKKKGAVRKGHGVMCNICGLNCGKGGALSKHVEGTHGVKYQDYKACFYPAGVHFLADSWDDRVVNGTGQTVVTRVLVQMFDTNPGKRGATKTARTPKTPTK